MTATNTDTNHFFFLMIRRLPISTLFPYTTLFRSCSSTWGWKQEKFQRWGKCFLLTSPSIEHPPRPQKRARIPTKPGLVSTRALSAGSCFIDRPYCAASLKASHRACPALGLATKERYTKICALYPRSQERSLTDNVLI